MGLFSIFGSKKTANQNKESVSEFYDHCVEAFHDEAKKCGLTEKGSICIPALMPLGESILHSLLQDRYYQLTYGSKPDLYNYVIMSMSIQTGIVLGCKWHENYEELSDSFISGLVREGPVEEAKPVLAELFGIADEQSLEKVFKPIFATMNDLNSVYKKDKTADEYFFKSLLAAYQLGVSMILGKY